MPVLTSKLIATLVDQVSGPAKAAGQAITGIGKALRSVNAVNGVQSAEQAMRRFTRTTQDAFAKAEAASHRFSHEMQHGIGIAALASGAAIGEALKSGIEQGADFAHQQALFQAVGMTGVEVANATAEAWRTTGEVAGTTIAGNLQAVRELRGVFGDTAEAAGRLAEVQRAAMMMKAINPKLNAEEQTFDLAKALEIKGVSQDPAHFSKLLNEMVRASNAMGGKVTGTDFLEFTKLARAAAPGLSDEFYTRYAPTLIGELGGESSGTAIASMYQALVGGKMSNKAADEFSRFGLVDPTKVIRTKTGSVKGLRDGAVVGSDLFRENPYQWAQQYLLPALHSHGVTDPAKIAEVMAHMFGNRNAEQIASMLEMQQSRFDKDRDLINRAQGAEGYDNLRYRDPTAGFAAFKASFSNLLTALTSPLMKPAAMALYYVTDGINRLAGALGRVPGLGAALGGVGGIIAATTVMRTVGRLGSLMGLGGGSGGNGLIATALLGRWSIKGLFGEIEATGKRTFLGVGRAILGLVNPLAIARGALTAFKIALAGTGIGLAILAIGAGAEFIRNNWEGVTVAFEAFRGAFERALGPLAEGSTARAALDLVKEIWDALTQPIKIGTWATWGIEAGKFAAGLATSVGEAINTVMTKWDALKASIDELLNRKFNIPWFLGGGTFSLTGGTPGFSAPNGSRQATPSPSDLRDIVRRWLTGSDGIVRPPSPQSAPTYAPAMDAARRLAALQRNPGSSAADLYAARQELDRLTSGLPAQAQQDMQAFVVALTHGGDEAVGRAHEIGERLRHELTITPLPPDIKVPIGGQPAARPSGAAYHTGDNHFHIYGITEPETIARKIHGHLQNLQQAAMRGGHFDFGPELA